MERKGGGLGKRAGLVRPSLCSGRDDVYLCGRAE